MNVIVNVNMNMNMNINIQKLQGPPIGGNSHLDFPKFRSSISPQPFTLFTDFTSNFHLLHFRNQEFTGHPCVFLDDVIPEHVEVL